MDSVAVILAAGMGSRLMPLTADKPKALVEIDGMPLLGRLLDACSRAGLNEAIVVTGYCAEAIDVWLGAHAPEPMTVATVFNEAFDTLGNAHSLWVAKEAVGQRGFVKFDGDLVVEHGIVAQLLALAAPSASCIDTRSGVDAEAMKATIEQGRVTALGKWLEVAQAAGESIGIEKIGAQDAPRVFDAIETLVQHDGNAYYEDAYHQLLKQGWALAACDIGAARWSEIDDATDLARARALFGSGT